VSKVITSPSKRWQGSVTLYDPLTLPQVKLIEAGLELPESAKGKERILFTVTDEVALPAIFACVEKWDISPTLKVRESEPLSVDNFVFSPRDETHELIKWIFDEIRRIYLGELEIPNE
jgi:NADPH-dependent ferric siderophore reductase